MRYLVLLIILACAAVLGMLGGGISVTITKGVMGLNPDVSEIIGWAVAIPIVLGFLLLSRWWVKRTFKKCSSCDSYVRLAATKCVYCKSDIA